MVDRKWGQLTASFIHLCLMYGPTAKLKPSVHRLRPKSTAFLRRDHALFIATFNCVYDSIFLMSFNRTGILYLIYLFTTFDYGANALENGQETGVFLVRLP